MSEEKKIRFKNGLKKIRSKKIKLLVPIFFSFLFILFWGVCRMRLPVFEIEMLNRIVVWTISILFVLGWGIGIFNICVRIGTPQEAKRKEAELIDINLVDSKGQPPWMLTCLRENGLYTYVFYSKTIPLSKYINFKDELSTRFNCEIEEIKQGLDKQHVIITCSPPETKLPEIIKWNDDYLSESDFEIVLGINRLKNVIKIDINSTPHVLCGGGTGSGKTQLLKLILWQCIKKDAEIVLFDYKEGLDYPQNMRKCFSICCTRLQIDEYLDTLINDMTTRQKILIATGYSNIHEFNKNSEENIRRIIVLFDEMGEFLDVSKKNKAEYDLVESIRNKLSSIARVGRIYGIHLFLTTQRPSSEVVDGEIKCNLGTRICGRADATLSRMILDNSDASEKISNEDKGVFLTNMGGVFKAFYVDDNSFDEGRV